MAQTLIGVFDNQSDAQQVAQELIGLGIDRTHVRVSSQDASRQGSSSSEDKGFWESVKDVLGFGDDDNDHYGLREAHRRGGTVVTVTTDDKWTDQVADVMRRHNVINLDERAQQWKSQGWSGYDRYQPSADAGTTQMADMDVASTATAGTPMASAGMTGGTMAGADMTTGARMTAGATHAAAHTQQGAEAIPVVEEEIRVGKREVSRGGVRVVSRVTERPVEENVNLREEHVHVERHAVDRPLTAADANAAFRERTIEATETAEEAVVSKNARVVEEVVVNKDVDQRTETVRDTVRRTDVDVQRTDADEARFRPAYEFADETSADARFRGRAFDEVETDLRSSYEQRNPGSRWDDVRDAVRSRYGRSSNKSNA